MPANSRKKRARRRLLFRLFTLAVLSVSAAGWWLWQQKKSHAPRLKYILIAVNGEPRKLLSGETLSLRPRDNLKITDISTTIPFNVNIRLVCKRFDVSALQYDTLTLTELLPQKDAFQRYKFRIDVKYLNHEIGTILWIIQPYAEDWLEKANRIIDDQMRLAILERGNGLLPDDGRIHDRLLDELMAQKKWKRAVPMLRKKAAKKTDIETLNSLLACYSALKDQSGIIRVLNQLLKKRPDDLVARARMAEILEGREEWDKAAKQYEIMIEHAPPAERLPLYKNLGFLHTKAGQPEKAVSAYLSAVNLDQKDPNLHYNLSALYEQLGQQKEADFYLNNAVTLNSDDFEGRLKLARRLTDKGTLEKARKVLSRLLEKKPDSKQGQALMANILEQQGDNGALRQVYEKILSLDPNNKAVSYNLGVLEYEGGNLKAALPYFEGYIKNHPEDTTVQEILFDIYRKENNTPAAYGQALILLELKPGGTDAYDFVFEYLKNRGEYDQLIPILEKEAKENPDQVRIKEYLAMAYLKAGKVDLGIREIEKLLRDEKSQAAPLLHELFEILVNRKSYQAIIDIMKKGVKADPENIFLREYLIFAYLKTGKETLAISEMEKILEQKPDDMELWLQLARLSEKKNQIPKSIKAYRRVLDLYPEHPEASEAYLRLRLEGVGGD
ncbi:MAG: tetratricopeptide repeat protein [Deltaproteobacteria bacterium]|nr:tetratricopeptide repeat protein [Deltaproteobacteria bacterium]